MTTCKDVLIRLQHLRSFIKETNNCDLLIKFNELRTATEENIINRKKFKQTSLEEVFVKIKIL